MANERASTVTADGNILIVGGYGQVGLSISERLARLFPGRVLVGGRNQDKATTAAVKIGHGATARRIDILAGDAGSALADVALVVVCLDQTDTKFAEACLSQGVHYVDISADIRFLSAVEKLDDRAKASRATAMLSVGTAPGLTNMLAAHARDRMKRPDRIDILLETGLGDQHGLAAVEWMFDNLDAEYQIRDGEGQRTVRSFGESLLISLPGQSKKRPAYRFNFSDQHVLARTLDIPSVSTWVRFDDRFTTWLFAVSARAGLGRLLRRPFWRRIAVWAFLNVHLGSDVCAVAVRARGETRDGSDELIIGIIGRQEALMTAIITVETARQILSGDVPPGVFHSEQAIRLDGVVEALQAEYPDLSVTL